MKDYDKNERSDMSLYESFITWLPLVKNKYINVDWDAKTEGFGAQCWDVCAHWSKFLGLPVISTFGPKGGRWPGWAGNMADAFPQNDAVAKAYTKLPPNSPIYAGDILVWSDQNSGWFPKTHTAVAIDESGSWVDCVSQNSTPSRADNPYPEWTTGPTIVGQRLPKAGLLAIIRPNIGSVNVQGSISTPNESEEDFMAGLIDAKQAEAIAQRAAALVVAQLNGKVLINPVQAESIVAATTSRTVEGVDAKNTGKLINARQADDIARAAARYQEEEENK